MFRQLASEDGCDGLGGMRGRQTLRVPSRWGKSREEGTRWAWAGAGGWGAGSTRSALTCSRCVSSDVQPGSHSLLSLPSCGPSTPLASSVHTDIHSHTGVRVCPLKTDGHTVVSAPVQWRWEPRVAVSGLQGEHRSAGERGEVSGGDPGPRFWLGRCGGPC